MSALTSSWTPRILSLLRFVTGYLLLTHGTAKILGFPKVDMFANLQITSLYGVAGILELVLGGLLVLGLFSRFAAFVASGLVRVCLFYWSRHLQYLCHSNSQRRRSGGSVLLCVPLSGFCWPGPLEH